MFGQLGLDEFAAADEEDTNVVVPCRLDRAFDLRLGSTVRAHRVQSYDAWHGLLG
jgi:hypothetical protein